MIEFKIKINFQYCNQGKELALLVVSLNVEKTVIIRRSVRLNVDLKIIKIGKHVNY